VKIIRAACETFFAVSFEAPRLVDGPCDRSSDIRQRCRVSAESSDPQRIPTIERTSHMNDEKKPLSKPKEKPESPDAPSGGPPVIGDPDHLTAPDPTSPPKGGTRAGELQEAVRLASAPPESIPEENGGPPVIGRPDE
jgi:hypothetical protein